MLNITLQSPEGYPYTDQFQRIKDQYNAVKIILSANTKKIYVDARGLDIVYFANLESFIEDHPRVVVSRGIFGDKFVKGVLKNDVDSNASDFFCIVAPRI